MEFILKIDCDNAAFDEWFTDEVARLLRETADRLDNNQTDGKIRDSNGNSVGEFGFSTLIRRKAEG